MTRTTSKVALSEVASDTSQHREVTPINELGCLLVLTHLLAAPLPRGTAIETLQLAARQIGWQPVGDVLCSAAERCLARNHLRLDAEQDLHLTELGRHWLIDMMSRRFVALPPIGNDLLLACQLIAAAQLNVAERQEILKAVALERRDQLRQQRACDRACPAALRPWQDWTRARFIGDLQRLDGLSAPTG